MDQYEELALEAAETAASGLKKQEKKLGKYVTALSFTADRPFPSFSLSREKGMYQTLLIAGNILEISDIFEETINAISACVKALIPKRKNIRKILAVGLGNPNAVVDALGSETVKRLEPGKKGKIRLCTLSPSVFGLTGIESADVARGVAKEVSPDLVLVVDSLATRKPDRLCRTVQITNAGVRPGGGVGNERVELTCETLGAPVLTLGVSLLCHARFLDPSAASLVVTPKEIDLYVPTFASALARGVERAFFPCS